MADNLLDSSLGELNIFETEDKLVIGVDFGTTYSGVAYLFTGVEKPEPIVVTEWPGAKGASKPKVPTLINYEGSKGSVIQWGYEIVHSSAEKIEGIKLLLDPDQPKPLYVPQSNTQAELKRIGKPAVDVAADYISSLYKHALSKIEAAWPEDYLQMLQKEFVLTVPAVWSDKAKASTEHAAKKAGIYPITVIKEPEAAALYTLHELRDKALSVGDAFVLCDAGGGTVDLISYEITELDPLQLRELVPGTGGLAGSLMINKRFEEAVKEAVGEEQYLTLRKHKAYRTAMQFFDESVKPMFNPNDKYDSDGTFYVNFPMAGLKDDPAKNISSNCFNVTRQVLNYVSNEIHLGPDILEGIFQPLVANINDLVKSQVDSVRIKRMEERHEKGKEIKAIFLVGGFGSSVYLRECLQRMHPDIQIIQPVDAWSAIVRGAVLSKAPSGTTIKSTVATRHYGVSAMAVWQQEDRGQPQVWDALGEVNRVAKMTWYIRIGDDLQRQQRISFPFFTALDGDYTQDELIFTNSLTQSEQTKPPKYKACGLTTPNCTLTADFRGVSRDKFKRRVRQDGHVYYEVHYALSVAFDSAVMKFICEVDGKEVGAVEAKYA